MEFSQDLEDRILRNCAALCVQSAQKLIDLIAEARQPSTMTCVMPWWYQVFYLWIATHHLIAAMLRPEVFESEGSSYWDKAIETLSHFKHLTPFVPRGIATLRNMWQKVLDIHKVPDTQPASDSFSDVSQHLGFGVHDIMGNIGVEDLGWLSNFDMDASEIARLMGNEEFQKF